MSTETNPVITISRTLFAQMRQQCLDMDHMRKESVLREERIKELMDQCYRAERDVLHAEMERCRLMLQIFEDSPSLSTSLLLAQPTKGGDSVWRDNCDPQMPPGKPVIVDKSESTALINPPLTVASNSGSVSKFLFDKLSVELWRTKKQLIAALDDRENAKISILDRQEYEEIVRRLEQDLLTLRHQYAQIRLAEHDHPDDVIAVVGELQDKVRKQQKVMDHQHAVLARLFPGEASSSGGTTLPVTQVTKDRADTQVEKEQVKETVGVPELKNELTEAWKVIRELRLKCQRMGGEYRDKLERLQIKGQPHPSGVNQQPDNQHIQLKEQLISMQKTVSSLEQERDLLTRQLSQVRGQMSALHDRHQQELAALHEDKAALHEDKAHSERIIKHLSEQVKTSRAQVQRYEDEVRELMRRAPKLSTCAQEVPPAYPSVLVSRGLLVDGNDTVETGNSDAEDDKEETLALDLKEPYPPEELKKGGKTEEVKDRAECLESEVQTGKGKEPLRRERKRPDEERKAKSSKD